EISYVNKQALNEDEKNKAENGEKIKIDGKKGEGKSKMVNLKKGFYEVNRGKILIEGVDSEKEKNNDYPTCDECGFIISCLWEQRKQKRYPKNCWCLTNRATPVFRCSL
ncbi:hypothetical protein MMJ02_07400, partial [Enterococcus cecorum]|nr:hypothetical protein [Enterococcus cecorum]